MAWQATYGEWLERYNAPGAVEMTEDEWRRCPLAAVMLRFLYAYPNGRKRRLFAVACCRRIAHSIPAQFLPFVDVAEAFAEGRASEEELQKAWTCAEWIMEGDEDLLPEGETPPCEFNEMLTEAERRFAYCAYRVAEPPETYDHPIRWSSEDAAGWVAEGAADAASFLPEQRNWEESKLWAERAVHADLLRDIYGNPFRPVIFEAKWRTGDVVKVAQIMYESGAFDGMRSLEEALQAAGCEERDVLDHCAADRPHVRGCWVVDALLGKP